MEQKESYKEILKATTLFGGVKVFGILISILRSKAIAIFIGAEGMGIASLLLTTVNLVNGLTNLGLDKSGIKEVALVSETKSEKELLRTTGLLMRLIWGTAVLGALAMLLFSPLLSWFAFGNYLYTISFIWLSLAMVFMHLTNGRLAILQGLRKHRALAKANIWGSFIALLLTVPLYYYFGINAIVPAIIISTMITLVITYKYSLGIYFKAVRVNFVKAYREGQPMIKLGLVLSFSGIMSLLAGYLLQVYISSINGTEAVGFYNAGYIILNSYLGLIFNAMATDYFPRLSGVVEKLGKTKELVFQQAHVSILLVTPIIVVFIAFAGQIIRLLYSGAFNPAIDFVKWAILGMFFKAVSFCIGYIIIAKGDSNLFVKTAIFFNVFALGINILGYHLYGLEGLGISFLIYYFVHLIALGIITNKRYGFYFPKKFYGLFIIGLSICSLAFAISYMENYWLKYVYFGILLLCSISISYYQLDRLLDFKNWLRNFFNRRK